MYQICVSGAAKGASVDQGKDLAYQLGAAIARAGHALMTGATVGLPNYAAEGYKAAGGTMSFGISPATNKVEHVRKYRLPTKAYDVILYSGLHYVGRDALLVTSSDAVLSIGGRLGTLHEFTVAIESDTPIGFLEGAGGISTQIANLMEVAGSTQKKAQVLFESDPDTLVENMTKTLNEELKAYKDLYV